jgi:hypothetical protein
VGLVHRALGPTGKIGPSSLRTFGPWELKQGTSIPIWCMAARRWFRLADGELSRKVVQGSSPRRKGTQFGVFDGGGLSGVARGGGELDRSWISGRVADRRSPAGFFGPGRFTRGRWSLWGEGLARGWWKVADDDRARGGRQQRRSLGCLASVACD